MKQILLMIAVMAEIAFGGVPLAGRSTTPMEFKIETTGADGVLMLRRGRRWCGG